MKKAFTLIELLVVIAIIAILAAILFPVFAQAKAAAKKAADLSNLNQLGKSTMLYTNDYDDTLYPHRFNCNKAGDPSLAADTVCAAYLDGNGNIKPEAYILTQDGKGGGNVDAAMRFYWVYMLQPYTKNYQVFKNPAAADAFAPGDNKAAPACGPNSNTGCKGFGYGGQNSYGHNDAWLSPAGSFGGGGSLPSSVVLTSVPRVASTIMITDASYYGALPDVHNDSGVADTSKMTGGDTTVETAFADAQGGQYRYYWKNVGSAKWSYTNGGISDAQAVIDGQKMHGGKINVQFTDGHTKSIDYKSVIGNICWWTTDIEGAHPNCG